MTVEFEEAAAGNDLSGQSSSWNRQPLNLIWT
jgi:hypothetical protein